jgi:hypothetical protein
MNREVKCVVCGEHMITLPIECSPCDLDCPTVSQPICKSCCDKLFDGNCEMCERLLENYDDIKKVFE